MTEKLNYQNQNPPARFLSNNYQIDKYIKRAQKIREKDLKAQQRKEKEKNRVKDVAYALWKLNGKPIESDKQDWKYAEKSLKPVYLEMLKPIYWMRSHLKLPIKKINWYMPVSFFISIICLAALLFHLEYLPLKKNEQIKSEQIKSEQIKFDTPALILFFLFLSPWFPFIFEKATLPGGLNLEFRKIKEQQYIQSKEIDNLNFLLLHFITDYEKNHLQKLNSSNRFTYEYKSIFEEELKRLLALELIKRHPGKGIRSFKKDKRWDNDLKEHFYITDKGKDYLARIEKFGKDEE